MNRFAPVATLAALLFHLPAHALERSDILLDIVSNCVAPTQAPAPVDYCNVCRAPRNDTDCGAALACKKNTEVWSLDTHYTVIRDIKMCGCPVDFVHGLAMPLAPVRGVEDPNRPDGIWQFGWDAAVKRMEPQSIALVVNPRLHRSQNQLHVHLLRLKQDARDLLDKEAPATVSNLNQVWGAAAQSATAKGLDDYGVIVVQRPTMDYLVVVTPESPESAFTKWRCD